MSDRKNVNMYYPPEWEPKMGSINKFRGAHPLRERAKKLDQGILVIRFEMPFNIWCGNEKCARMIGKGVRFNAEKKSIGKYYTTTIWEFSMKCPSCSQQIVVRTDPKNSDYDIYSGAKKKHEDYSAEDAEVIEWMDDETRRKIREDPMLSLELRGADKRKADIDAERMLGLVDLQTRMLDDYSLQRKMRASFRVEKKAIKKEEEESTRGGLSLKLVPSTNADKKMASQQWFGSSSMSDLDKSRRLRLQQAATSDAKSCKQGVASSQSTRKKAIATALRNNIDVTRLRVLKPIVDVKKKSPAAHRVVVKKRRRIAHLQDEPQDDEERKKLQNNIGIGQTQLLNEPSSRDSKKCSSSRYRTRASGDFNGKRERSAMSVSMVQPLLPNVYDSASDSSI